MPSSHNWLSLISIRTLSSAWVSVLCDLPLPMKIPLLHMAHASTSTADRIKITFSKL
jgi:hypothetical protein